jgi:hypothetical protein
LPSRRRTPRSPAPVTRACPPLACKRAREGITQLIAHLSTPTAHATVARQSAELLDRPCAHRRTLMRKAMRAAHGDELAPRKARPGQTARVTQAANDARLRGPSAHDATIVRLASKGQIRSDENWSASADPEKAGTQEDTKTRRREGACFSDPIHLRVFMFSPLFRTRTGLQQSARVLTPHDGEEHCCGAQDAKGDQREAGNGARLRGLLRRWA